MLKENFMVGPFEISPAGHDTYDIFYGVKPKTRGVYVPGKTRQAVAEALSDVLIDIKNKMRDATALHCIKLVTPTGDKLDEMWGEGDALNGLAGAIPDDRFPFWAKCGLLAAPVTIAEWRGMAKRIAAPRRAWIANLLPSEILDANPDTWRAPTAWEIRHIVGEGSLTGMSGAKAAALIGISPANFRKYTASEGAANRQSISFAGWHLLLLRMEIVRP